MPDIHSNHRVIVIDDNPAIHADFKKILQPGSDVPAEMASAEAELFGSTHDPGKAEVQFQVSCASSGQEGFALVEAALQNAQPFALAFVDVRMPVGWDGVETAAKILAADRDIQVVMCTAFSDYSWGEMMDRLGRSDRVLILKKPFDSIEALQLAHALTEKWSLHQVARAKLDESESLVRRRTAELQHANAQLKGEMAERARAEEALRQSQKMEALGQLTGGVAHDFNNLLTVIRGYAQCLLADGHQKPAAHDALLQIESAAERAANLTSQMLVFSRKKRLQPEHLNLNDVISQLNKMLRRLVGEDICLQFQPCPELLSVHADRAMIEQIVLNLVVNARDAMPKGGLALIRTDEIQVTEAMLVTNARARKGTFARVTVSDTGCGIDPAVLPRLFEPFFTTKEPGKGTGLGLATTYGIVKQHEGWIDVKSRLGQGATFEIYLPVSSPNGTPVPVRQPREDAAGGTETILLVEDEEALRSLAVKILTRNGYRVVPASSGVEALSIWDQHSEKIDLLLTDMVMPDGISGWTLAQELQAKKPLLKTIFTTGYSLDAVCQEHQLTEGFNFLPKPYHPQDLVGTIRRRLDERLMTTLPTIQ